ncbi:MAG TPA: 50S ribosomal protein L4 [Planctomycetota bacterium]|nr:50S ribosomal protein L4 [Planctomycetota bacterium]
MKIQVYKGGKLSQGEVDETRFGEKVLYRLLKESVDSYRANQRQGTVKTIGRDEVAGSHKKPWKQKHTGRARAGDRKSPIWRGGGTVFGPKPRDYTYTLPAKERRVALRSALFGKLADGEVVEVDLSGFDAPSAKAARAVLAGCGVFERKPGEVRKVLLVLTKPNETAWKSFRNFPELTVRRAIDLCAFDVISSRIVLAEIGALDAVAERVGVAAAEGGAQ